jgi:hypothetical protein
MKLDPTTVSSFARRLDINEDDFSALIQQGEAVTGHRVQSAVRTHLAAQRGHHPAHPLHLRHRGEPRALHGVCPEFYRLVTALNPVLGYEKSSAIAKEALKTGGSVYDLVLQTGWLTREPLDDMLKPENMISPRAIP